MTSGASGVPADALLPVALGPDASLDPVSADDADEAYAVVDAERERLREWLPWVDGTRDVETLREFLSGLVVGVATGVALSGTIRCEARFAGAAGLRIDPMNASAEVGYWLAAAFTGRGLMTAAVAALCDVGFERLALHRITLRAATGNARSRAVAERLGLRHEGTAREAERFGDRYLDLEVYAALASEWPAARHRAS